jgi:hypothetical protein
MIYMYYNSIKNIILKVLKMIWSCEWIKIKTCMPAFVAVESKKWMDDSTVRAQLKLC